MKGKRNSPSRQTKIVFDSYSYPGTIADFCRTRGVARSTLYYWRGKVHRIFRRRR